MKKNKDIFSKDGYKSTSKDKNKPRNLIPSGRITMKGVPHPVYGIDDMGNEMMMYPGNEYIFPGNIVTEYPIRQQGGSTGLNKKEYDRAIALYNDSLQLYNAYQFQKNNIRPLDEYSSRIKKGSTKKDIAGWDPKSAKKRRLTGEDYKNLNDYKKDWPKDYSGHKVVNYYKGLNFSSPTEIMYHTSPDLVHPSIKPIKSYYDGEGWSPVYMKPRVNPKLQQTPTEAQEKVMTLDPRKVTGISHDLPIPVPIAQQYQNTNRHDIELPNSSLKWVQGPNGTWYQIQRPARGPKYDLNTGSTHMQKGGETKTRSKVRYTDEEKFNRANELYNDSLNLYNSYQYHIDNFNPYPFLQDIIDLHNKKGGPYKGLTPEQVLQLSKKEYGTIDSPKGIYKMIKNSPTNKNTPSDKRLGSDKIYDYYNNLDFKRPVAIDNGLSPSIFHRDIDPTQLYFDGISHSPIYQDPSVEPVYEPIMDILPPKEIERIGNIPTVAPIPDPREPGPNEVILPGSNLEWVKSPGGTWHQIERRANGPKYNLKTGSTRRQQGGEIANPHYQKQLELYNSFNNPSVFTDVNNYKVLEGEALDQWYNQQIKDNPNLTQDGAFVGGYKPAKVYVNETNDSYYQTYNKPSRTIPSTQSTKTNIVNPTIPVKTETSTPAPDPNGWRTATVISLKKADGSTQDIYVPFGTKYPRTGYSYEQFIQENGELGEYNIVPPNVKGSTSSFQSAVTPVPFPEDYGQNSKYMQYARKLRELKLKENQQKSTTTSMKSGGETNTWDPAFYQDKKQCFMDWIKNAAGVNNKETAGYIKQVGGAINSRAYSVGRVYSSPFDQPISPDIYNDPQFDSRNTTITNTNYGRKQANVDYTTTGVKSQPFNQVDLSNDMGSQVPGNFNTSSINWNYNPTPELSNMEEPMMIDSNVDPIQSREQIVMDVGRATFDRNKPLERNLRRQDRDRRKNSISGETKANILLSGLNFVNNLAGQDERKRYEEQLQRQYAAENLYTPVTGYRGDYLVNPQGSNFRPDDYSFGNFGKIYKSGGQYTAGGEYEMTDEELQAFIAGGGEVEFLD